ncbi:hypothetical protein FSC37_05430 [Piscinibacter aquaticus]|uniref:Uncharacterized protein n=1 Tax=Piscinibacter aquaticus TaxID=392597 RepID=A0A5C6TYP1_9BURK|nr:hypothetical protein FSC37_05430 [Piscinibacter aquaticus]
MMLTVPRAGSTVAEVTPSASPSTSRSLASTSMVTGAAPTARAESSVASGASLTATTVSTTAAGAEVAPALSVTVNRMLWLPLKSAPGR